MLTCTLVAGIEDGGGPGVQTAGVHVAIRGCHARRRVRGLDHCLVPNNEDSPGVELMDSSGKRTGAMLAAARAAAGLELVDVAQETRVPLRHLKALEADRHEDLPALPYAIGFVKSFARAVGLDPETVATQFRGETSKSPHVPAPLTLEPLDERRLPSSGLVAASVGIVILIIAGLSAWGAGLFDPAAPGADSVAAVPGAGVADPAAADPAAADPARPQGTVAGPDGVTAPFTGAAAVPGLPANATGPVVLTAREEVWVKIYDRSSRASAKIGILQPGESFTVPADQPNLLLWTGKAGALAITVGGQPLPPLGGPVDTVRDVSLAAADLIARTTPGVSGGAPAAASGSAPASGGPKPIATIPGA
jgi:cytoskeleton protein RodZ